MNDGARRPIFVDLSGRDERVNNLPVHIDVAYFGAPGKASIVHIDEYLIFVAMHQRCRSNDVGHNYRHGSQVLYRATFAIDAYIHFLKEGKLILYRWPAHVGVAIVVNVFGRRRRVNDGGLNHGARAIQQALIAQSGINGGDHALGQFIGLQQTPVSKQYRRIRCRLARQIHA